MPLPPGFRFHPTDEELVDYYLIKRVKNVAIEYDVIADVDLYKCEPWDLPSKSRLPQVDNEWFFFSPRDRKYPNGSRTNRATEAGYWKATGRDRTVKTQVGARIIGMKKTLVFYRGRAPHGERTDWLMHEYRLDGVDWEAMNVPQDAYVLCRVFKKGTLPPKNPSVGSGSLDDVGDQIDSPGEVKSSPFVDNDVKPQVTLPTNLISQQAGPLIVKEPATENYSIRPFSTGFPDEIFSQTNFASSSALSDFFLDEGLDKVIEDFTCDSSGVLTCEDFESFWEEVPPLPGNIGQLEPWKDAPQYPFGLMGFGEGRDQIPPLIDETECVRTEFTSKWQEQVAGAQQVWKEEDQPYPVAQENDFAPLQTLSQLPNSQLATDIQQTGCSTNDLSSNSNFTTIQIRPRSAMPSAVVGGGFSSPWTAPRRVLLQRRGANASAPPSEEIATSPVTVKVEKNDHPFDAKVKSSDSGVKASILRRAAAYFLAMGLTFGLVAFFIWFLVPSAYIFSSVDSFFIAGRSAKSRRDVFFIFCDLCLICSVLWAQAPTTIQHLVQTCRRDGDIDHRPTDTETETK